MGMSPLVSTVHYCVCYPGSEGYPAGGFVRVCVASRTGVKKENFIEGLT